MRRPEGYDRSAADRAAARRSSTERVETPRPDRARAGRSSTLTLERPSLASPNDGSPDAAEPAEALRGDDAPARRRRTRAPRTPRPARIRTAHPSTAKAELRAAARARRREERAEIRRFTRRSRRRRRAALALGGVLVALVLMVVGAVYSPLLQLRRIDIQGASRLSPAQLRGAVDGQLGTPLALLDETRLTRELGAFPLIRSYSTEIVPPDTLVIRIVERAPVAALEDGSSYELVDAAGVPVAESASRPAGTPLVQLPTGQGVDGAAFRAMARVLVSLPAPLLGRVDTVTATSSDDVAFTLTGANQTIVWGDPEDAAQKYQTLTAMQEYRAGRSGRYSVASVGTATFTTG